MKNIIFSALISLLAFGCVKNDQIGYLVADEASYSVDEMQVRIELDLEPGTIPSAAVLNYWADPRYQAAFGTIENLIQALLDNGSSPLYLYADPPLDYEREQLSLPWESVKIEGIRGTNPIRLEIYDIKSDNGGDIAKMKENLTIRGDGTFFIPFVNTVTVGTYVMSIRVYNEGWEHILEDCFTIDVVQNVDTPNE